MKSTVIIPCLQYKEARKAIDWLCEAFGFEEHLVVPGDNGTIAHAQLNLGGAMLMLSSAKSGTELSGYFVQPSEVEGRVTQAPYVILKDEDLDTHFQKAKSAGAKIIIALREEEYGGRNYSCTDIEGHVWSFGSYDPWE